MKYTDDTVVWRKYGEYVRAMITGNYLTVQEWVDGGWEDRRTFHTISEEMAFANADDLANELQRKREGEGGQKECS